MTWHLVFKGQAEFIPGSLIENEDSVLADLVIFGEITSFHDVYSHESQEIPTHGITLEIDPFALEFPAPAHSSGCDNIAVGPCDIGYVRIRYQAEEDVFLISAILYDV